MKIHFLAAMAAVSLVACAATAQASSITWGAATNISGDLDINTTGSLVRAFNINLNNAATTVNGVLFENHNGGSGTVGDFDFALSNQTIDNSSPDGLSAAYFALVRGGSFLSANFATATITMNNLQVGQTYLFEWWSNLGDATGDYRTTATGGTGLDANVTGTPGGRGQFQIGTFVADATSQSISFTGAGPAGPFGVTGVVNGFQLRAEAAPTAVPEPGGTAFLGFAMMGVAELRRRYRAWRAR